MPARNRLDRYDEYGQDTWVSPDEESFAAEMGQPSTEPNPAHEPHPADRAVDRLLWQRRQVAHQREADQERRESSVVPFPHHRPAVLAQTPVRCNRCDRMAVPFEDTIVLVDGVWFCEGCVGEES